MIPSSFSVNATTGQVTIKGANLFDFESAANRSFTLTVRATEDGDRSLTTADSVLGDQVITLTITDVNEAPTAVFTPGAPALGVPTSGPTGSVTINLPAVQPDTTIGSLSITDPDLLAAMATFGPDSLVVTVLDNSSTTAPAFTYVPNAVPATGGLLKVSSLSTLQSKVGKTFTVRFTIKDKNGLSGALTSTLTLSVKVTNVLQVQ